MKALVTGVAGFIGSSLAKRLTASGWDVCGIDALTDYYELRLKRSNLSRLLAQPNFRFVEEDLLFTDLSDLLQGVDCVFHQAGQPGVRKSWGRDFAIYSRQNIDATQRLLEAALKYGRLQRLVYASSSSVYGDADRYPTVETDRPSPISPYGVTKLAAEHLVSLYGSQFGLPTTSLRYFTVYGPGQRPDMAFHRFCSSIAVGGEISVFGDGEQVRDFTFISDVVSANVLAATHGRSLPPGVVFNVAGGTNVSVNETLETLERISGRAANVKYLPVAEGDVRRTGGDSGRIRSELQWSPRVKIEDGLAAEFNWVQQIVAVQ